ncbi:Inhibitory regulator protein BUD2/CLA2 [Pseudozyma hubeiensis]|nr:Inhibitory regulator protein BUD2/CLA2 [Pseudozyma hubeiensis]
MSGAHPLWPDYVPQQRQHQTTAPSNPASAATGQPAASTHHAGTFSSASALSPSSSSVSSSSRRIPNDSNAITHASPSSRVLRKPSPAISPSIAHDAARDAALGDGGRRSMHQSLDRSPPQAAPSAASLELSHDASLLRSTSSFAVSSSSSKASRRPVPSQQPFEPQSDHERHSLTNSSAAVDPPPVSRLPASSSAASTQTSSINFANLPPSSSSSNSLGRNLLTPPPQGHTFEPSTSPLTSTLPSRPTSDIQSSRLAPSQQSSSQTDMRHNIEAFEPTLPPSSFAARRDASFARLRSGSGSISAQSRAVPAGDAEVSITVHVWWPSTSKSSSSTLARAPLFRDAANVKQKISMRTTSSQGRTTELNHDAVFERASFGFRHGAHSWLREKPSKARLNAPSSSVGPLGQWKRAILLFRENGSLSIFGEGNALTHTLQCGALTSSDVRSVDDSLFGRPHVLSIRPRQPRHRTEISITTRKQEAALEEERARSSEPIFVHFSTQEHLRYLKALLLIYAMPEIYGSAATVDDGGTHRFFRQLDVTISDAKSITPKWPSEPGENTSPSVGNHPSTHAHLPSSPTSTATTGGFTTFSSEPARSLSHQLASLRFDDQDDSPASEPLTEDAMSGSSRAGSRPSSRPSSRMRHNAQRSVSSLRADADDDAGSGSSRPASRASLHEHQTLMSDEGSSRSHNQPVPVPLGGQSGASRFASVSTPASELAASCPGASSYLASRASAQQRRDDKDRYDKARFDRYCRIRLDGELVARTSLSRANSSAFAVDKFKLHDAGDAKSLIIEVLHPTEKTNTSLTGSPSQTINKYILLGIVEIPIETLRRNEEIEGRYPIWSVSTFPSLSQQQASSSIVADEDDAKPATSFHRGVVGELSLSIRLQEGAVMPLSMYDEIYRMCHHDDIIGVVRQLATTMREDLLVSQITRICAASGTIASRISSLIELESANWGEKLEPELLFRANTLLSRSVDHFQRLLALSWLDDCLGPTVRKICYDPLAQARPDTANSSGSAGSAADDGQFDFSTSIRSPPSLPANAIDSIPDGPMTINALRKLSESMWQNIYRQRHSCPPDLRGVLHQIRIKVNERYRGTKSAKPGIQAVGSFVFLRLFCAALNSPQLYGLASSQPSRSASRKLLLLSKVLLALASKKTAFDKDKDWELVPLNDLLRTYSSAYDDYISVISTEPPTSTPTQWLGIRIDGDADLQAAALRRSDSLSRLHRESIPRAPYMLDQPQALASFVSFVADSAPDREQADLSHGASGARTGGSESDQAEADRIKQKAADFVQACCRIEEAAGMCIEQAGYDPRPIPWERLQRTGMSQRHGEGGRSSAFESSSALGGQSRESVGSLASSTATLSTVRMMGNDARETGDSSPSSGLSRNRSRRATVGTANARPRMSDSMKDRDSTLDRAVANPDGGSPKSARRKSVGVAARSGLKTTQISTETHKPGSVNNSSGTGRRTIEKDHTRDSAARQTPAVWDTRSHHRSAFARLRNDEDEHGSDDELRQAYRTLRAEEEGVALGASRSEGHTGNATAETATTGKQRALSPLASDAMGSGRNLQTTVALLEADDGSTFVPVHPVRTARPDIGSESPLLRDADQGGEQARPHARQAKPIAPHAAAAPSTVPATAGVSLAASDVVSAAEPKPASSLPIAPLDLPESCTSDRSEARNGLSVDKEAAGEADTNRRHSLGQTLAVARNYSLPRPAADRKGLPSHEHQDRESSDGFESAIEDAYAQTRASLPPSASMPVFRGQSSSSAGGSAGMARFGDDASVDIAAAKKKKWWKP